MTVVVAPFRREHVGRVAVLHCRALPGLLSALGSAAAAAFYEGYLASPRCVAFVDEQDATLRGFVLGSDDPETMRRDALRANTSGIALRTGASLLRRPRALLYLVGAAAGPRQGGFDPRAPELTYIAVREEARGAGVGSALLAAFDAGLRLRGVARYELSVEADNEAAMAFYEAKGLKPTGSYRQFGRTYRRYAKQLPPLSADRGR
jgi:ribosomal protein S18 acetylase RimI-like enzyme